MSECACECVSVRESVWGEGCRRRGVHVLCNNIITAIVYPVHTSLYCSVERQENMSWPSSCSRARAWVKWWFSRIELEYSLARGAPVFTRNVLLWPRWSKSWQRQPQRRESLWNEQITSLKINFNAEMYNYTSKSENLSGTPLRIQYMQWATEKAWSQLWYSTFR